MKIGVRAHDFGKTTSINLAKQAKAYGFAGVQLALNKAIEGQTAMPGTLNNELASSIANDFSSAGLEIALLGSYFNPVHSNKEGVKTNMQKFKEHLQYAKKFNCNYVGSETGSFNDDQWTYNPLNRTEEAYQEIKRIFAELIDVAKKYNVNLAIEGAYGHCCYEPKVLKRLLDDIDNGHMYITVDLFNYLAMDNYKDHLKLFDECLELFEEKIVIFHLKDFIIKGNTLKMVGLGQGLINFDYILPKIKKNCPDAYLIFEGVDPADMRSSMKFIQERI